MTTEWNFSNHQQRYSIGTLKILVRIITVQWYLWWKIPMGKPKWSCRMWFNIYLVIHKFTQWDVQELNDCLSIYCHLLSISEYYWPKSTSSTKKGFLKWYMFTVLTGYYLMNREQYTPTVIPWMLVPVFNKVHAEAKLKIIFLWGALICH